MRPAELDGPSCPDELAYLWDWYCELAAARGSNGWGLNPICYAEIAAWAALTGRDPSPFEVGCIARLDRAELSAIAQRNRKP